MSDSGKLNTSGGESRSMEETGRKNLDDLADISEITEKTLVDFMCGKDHDLYDYISTIPEGSETPLQKKMTSIDLELSLQNFLRMGNLANVVRRVKQDFMGLNSLIDKMTRFYETVGVNKEVRKMIFELAHKASRNSKDMKIGWHSYTAEVQEKRLRSFDELQKALEEVRQEYEETTRNPDSKLTDSEKFYVPGEISRSQSELSNNIVKEKMTRRMIDVMLKETNNIAELGLKLFLNSKDDYDIHKEEREESDGTGLLAWKNKTRNLQNELITQIDISRNKLLAETETYSAYRAPDTTSTS